MKTKQQMNDNLKRNQIKNRQIHLLALILLKWRFDINCKTPLATKKIFHPPLVLWRSIEKTTRGQSWNGASFVTAFAAHTGVFFQSFFQSASLCRAKKTWSTARNTCSVPQIPVSFQTETKTFSTPISVIICKFSTLFHIHVEPDLQVIFTWNCSLDNCSFISFSAFIIYF